MVQSFRDLTVWQRSIQMAVAVYRLTQGFPRDEIYGLTSQMRRAAVSIPSNIAEGQAHYSNREFRRFLRHSRGSLAELETQVLIALRRNYLSESQANELLRRTAEVGRILNGLINSLQERVSAAQ